VTPNNQKTTGGVPEHETDPDSFAAQIFDIIDMFAEKDCGSPFDRAWGKLDTNTKNEMTNSFKRMYADKLRFIYRDCSPISEEIRKAREDVLDEIGREIMKRTGIDRLSHFNPDTDRIPTIGVDELSEIIKSLRSNPQEKDN
jgi:hypothetical protein